MASHRKRTDNSWEFKVQKKGLLPKPIFLTFSSEQEGIDYCKHLEALLAQGIVPEEFLVSSKAGVIATVADAIYQYSETVSTINPDDFSQLNGMRKLFGKTSMHKVDYEWAENVVAYLKKEDLAPSTIRKKIEALARCFDWLIKKKNTMLVSNPLRILPKGYANMEYGREDIERDRRLEAGEEEKILKILDGEKPEKKQRALAADKRKPLRMMFVIALETAMRMREIYTLTSKQVDVKNLTIFLDKTKNGDKRQIPMSSVLAPELEQYLKTLGEGDAKLFQFWDGKIDRKSLRASSGRLSQTWASIFAMAECDDLRFHDLRHEATSRFYERTKMSDIKISRITGHKNLQMLRRYSNLRGSELAPEMW